MKTLLLTHKADIDGLTPLILLNQIRDDIDAQLLNANDIIAKVSELIKTKQYAKYDEIYITDLTIDKPTCELIMSTGHADKFHVFDHHEFNLIANDYSFGTAICKNSDGVNECATSLFYKYLVKVYPETFDNADMQRFVEYVRSIDTWDWSRTNNTEAKKLDDLHGILGREKFVGYYTDLFKTKKPFVYTEAQEYLLEVEQDRIKRYMEETEKTMFHATLFGHPCGIVFAEQHRSLLGNYLAQKYSYMLDYIIMINMQQGLSFRCIKDGIDLSQFASVYGGGGHIKAAGAPLDNALKREVIKLILNDDNMF